jgi:redox-sensitive bicupin YhaK (pirin superfamily)
MWKYRYNTFFRGEPMTAIEQIIAPRRRDLGGFEVSRVLPYMQRRSVGPFVFFDHMGPVTFAPGKGIDVRPHPHIGLATVTYLFEGAFMHRDSLGTVQTIVPGDVNWMTAGRAIVHSERSPDDLRAAGHKVHGIQSWVALPKDQEQAAPSFAHHTAASLPRVERGGATLRVIAGTAFGVTSPVQVFADTLYVDADLGPGATFTLPADHEERAVYAVDSAVSIGSEVLPAMQMAVLKPGVAVDISAPHKARCMILGGAPLDAPRLMWWNFVASSEELMERAKVEWRAAPGQQWRGTFGLPPGEQEFIPLPES